MISQFVKLIMQSNLLVSDEEFDGEDLADILWLATKINIETSSETPLPQPKEPEVPSASNPDPGENPGTPNSLDGLDSPSKDKPPEDNDNPFVLGPQPSDRSRSNSGERRSKGLPFKTPAAPPLRRTLEVSRALRPLMRKVQSRTVRILDEEGTAIHFAQAKFFMPILQPATERWLDLSFVVEECGSTIIWKETITAFRKLLEGLGAFRNVRAWILRTAEDGSLQLFPQQSGLVIAKKSRSLKELSDPSKRRLMMLVSDCTSLAWQEGKIYEKLHHLFQGDLVVIFQLLPTHLWDSSALGKNYQVQLRSEKRGDPINRLIESGFPDWEDHSQKILKLPVTNIEPEVLAIWAKAIAGTKSTKMAGYLVDLEGVSSSASVSETSVSLEQPKPLTPIELAQRFWVTASHQAKELAKLLAAVPISMPVVHLIQETMLPESMQTHTAEVFLSGIIKRSDLEEPINSLKAIQEKDLSSRSDSKSNQTSRAPEVRHYDFVDDQIREFLIERASVSKIDDVLEKISEYIAKKAGKSIHSFTALLVPGIESDEESLSEIRAFARIAKRTLLHIGGEYAALVRELEALPPPLPRFLGFPALQTFTFETVEIESEEVQVREPVSSFPPLLQIKQFTVATISLETNGLELFKFIVATIQKSPKKPRRNADQEWIIQRQQGSAYQFIETLGDNLNLEMVAIPGGSFLMGSPHNEPMSDSHEKPQHEVTIESFYMGRYPITQSQWKAVAKMPQIDRELKSDPASFKGGNRPVESVSWYEAVEFCARLTSSTNRQYRLPSEAEWEYACRAGTTTPFHFGETITTEFANYDGGSNYNNGPKGENRSETTSVDDFGIANAFGLSDMHGNVWEWCADHWHDNYNDAPTDGSSWIDSSRSKNLYVRRGGSWVLDARACRSASRPKNAKAVAHNHLGFRVCFSVTKT
jgi:formylglycine-generating enzyme required for sulfatase activity